MLPPRRPRPALLGTLTALVALTVAPAAAQDDPIGHLGEDLPGEIGAVHTVMNTFHRAASEADFDTYMGLFTEDGVFLGTDATERWTTEEFAAFTRPYFERGRGWTYVPTERWVSLSPDGTVAWFDERLENAGLGDTRGSGVLVLLDGRWRVAQYNLTIPVPNDLANTLVEMIREGGGGR